MHLLGLSASHILSIGEPVKLDDLGRVSVLIGRNNVGKSQVLRLIDMLRAKAEWQPASTNVGWQPTDFYVGGDGVRNEQLSLRLFVRFTDEEIGSLARETFLGAGEHGDCCQDHISWALKTLRPGVQLAVMDSHEHGELRDFFCQYGGLPVEVPASLIDGDKDPEHYTHSLLSEMVKLIRQRTFLVPAWRHMKDNPQNTGDYHSFLLGCANPAQHELHRREVFDRIQEFFRQLTGLPNAEILPSYNGGHTAVKVGRAHALAGILRRWHSALADSRDRDGSPRAFAHSSGRARIASPAGASAAPARVHPG